MSADWTPEEVVKAKELWEAGYTATQVSDRLHGLHSRNSVIGKAHRGLWRHGATSPPPSYLKRTKTASPPKPAVSKGFAREINRLQNDGADATEISETLHIAERYAEKLVTARRTSTRKPSGATHMDSPVVPELVEPSNQPVRLIDSHDGQCKWIVGDIKGADTLYCGAPNSGESAYCRWHNTKAYNQTGVKSHDPQRLRW